MNFICDLCREAADTKDPQLHEMCKANFTDKTHCDCQHETGKRVAK